MRLFDSHAHLNQDDFDADRDDVIARAQAAGVESDRDGRLQPRLEPAEHRDCWPLSWRFRRRGNSAQ